GTEWRGGAPSKYFFGGAGAPWKPRRSLRRAPPPRAAPAPPPAGPGRAVRRRGLGGTWRPTRRRSRPHPPPPVSTPRATGGRERGEIAAGHDQQVPGLRALHAAADRRVQHVDTLFGEQRVHSSGEGRRVGGVVDIERARL